MIVADVRAMSTGRGARPVIHAVRAEAPRHVVAGEVHREAACGVWCRRLERRSQGFDTADSRCCPSCIRNVNPRGGIL